MSTWLAKSKAKVVNFHFIQEKPFIFYHLSYKCPTKAFPLMRFPFMVQLVETQSIASLNGNI